MQVSFFFYAWLQVSLWFVSPGAIGFWRKLFKGEHIWAEECTFLFSDTEMWCEQTCVQKESKACW